MERHFTIPIAIAAVAHSALIFSGGTPLPRTAGTTVHVIDLGDRPDPPTFEPEPIDSDDRVVERRPSNPPPIRQREFPDPNPGPAVIWQKMDPSRPGTAVPNPTIDRILPGWIEDVIDPGAGHGPVSAVLLDNRPAARFQPAPAYPRDRLSTGIEGRVTVTFSVDTSGRVYDAVVVSADDPAFGDEALRAVRKWRFEPGIKGNVPVAFRMSQTFEFTVSR